MVITIIKLLIKIESSELRSSSLTLIIAYPDELLNQKEENLAITAYNSLNEVQMLLGGLQTCSKGPDCDLICSCEFSPPLPYHTLVSTMLEVVQYAVSTNEGKEKLQDDLAATEESKQDLTAELQSIKNKLRDKTKIYDDLLADAEQMEAKIARLAEEKDNLEKRHERSKRRAQNTCNNSSTPVKSKTQAQTHSDVPKACHKNAASQWEPQMQGKETQCDDDTRRSSCTSTASQWERQVRDNGTQCDKISDLCQSNTATQSQVENEEEEVEKDDAVNPPEIIRGDSLAPVQHGSILLPKSNTTAPTEPKIRIIGSSNTRGIASMVKDKLPSWSVVGTCIPGADLSTIMNATRGGNLNLTQEDHLIIFGGMNDYMNGRQEELDLTEILRMAQQTNVILAEIRKPIKQSNHSRMAQNIRRQNNAFHLAANSKLKILPISDIARGKTMKDGIHLNQRGKGEVARRIAAMIKGENIMPATNTATTIAGTCQQQPNRKSLAIRKYRQARAVTYVYAPPTQPTPTTVPAKCQEAAATAPPSPRTPTATIQGNFQEEDHARTSD